jgi:protein-L-isoaspartate(D-aspartate) O-methyltransferase
VPPDGSVLAGGPQARRYAGEAAAVLDRWQRQGRPRLQSWRITLTPAGRPDAPIWAPAHWEQG